ncbi:hemerythrin domain-containing protein [Nonomuraea sp. NPDC050556]|uniref:hemerythrin domain-containing protein n=1 Tax=Nonomuraea sp. NPDC050556 TaxID=3364369 RepID=UPI0037915E54
MAPNLLGIRIAHRAMRADTRRLAVLMNEIAAGELLPDAVRLRAIGGFATRLCATIKHHHETEDDVLWPIIVRSAGAAADLSDLTEDHEALDPLLDEVVQNVAAPARMAKALARLADLLDEHIEEEERLIFPLITRYVSDADWKTVEDAARKGSKLSFELPRIAQYARPDEMDALREEAGPLMVALLALFNRGHRRRQRLIFA